jgi:serine/threonine protein phosphatase PrpC
MSVDLLIIDGLDLGNGRQAGIYTVCDGHGGDKVSKYAVNNIERVRLRHIQDLNVCRYS